MRARHAIKPPFVRMYPRLYALLREYINLQPDSKNDRRLTISSKCPAWLIAECAAKRDVPCVSCKSTMQPLRGGKNGFGWSLFSTGEKVCGHVNCASHREASEAALWYRADLNKAPLSARTLVSMQADLLDALDDDGDEQ
jgi:hypothetical protein